MLSRLPTRHKLTSAGDRVETPGAMMEMVSLIAPTKSSYAITIRDYLLPTPSDIKSPVFSLCKNFFDPLDSGKRKIKVYAYHPSSNTCSINYPRMQNLQSEHPMGSLL
ncbi:hypothetical protein L1887_22673 [Cichorium endivia]|nr:hypothetical protein L1887_22673 [Cichorium endivia]